EDVRGQRAQLLASDQVLEGGRLERFQDALRAGGLEEGTLADAARRPRGNLLEPAQIDDLTARRYEPTIRRKQVPCQDRSGQGEVHHALEGPGGGGGPASGRKRNLPAQVRDKGTEVAVRPTFPPTRRRRGPNRPIPGHSSPRRCPARCSRGFRRATGRARSSGCGSGSGS